MIEDEQAMRRCTLPIYDGPWTGGKDVSCYLGRPPAWELLEPQGHDIDPLEYPGYGKHWTDPKRPWESLVDGCPGGWYRCEFLDSLRPYRRRMVEGGGHDANPRLDRTDHWLVLEAVRYYEDCESHARSEYLRELDRLTRVR